MAAAEDIEFEGPVVEWRGPKDGRYLLPLKDSVRRPSGIEVDQTVTVALRVGRS